METKKKPQCFSPHPLNSAVVIWVFRKDSGGPQHQPGAAGNKHSPQREARPHGTAREQTMLRTHKIIQNEYQNQRKGQRLYFQPRTWSK